MNSLQKTAVEKNCKLVPGAENLDVTVGNEPNANEPSDLDIYGLAGEGLGRHLAR
jgi:hypothetical protein